MAHPCYGAVGMHPTRKLSCGIWLLIVTGIVVGRTGFKPYRSKGMKTMNRLELLFH